MVIFSKNNNFYSKRDEIITQMRNILITYDKTPVAMATVPLTSGEMCSELTARQISNNQLFHNSNTVHVSMNPANTAQLTNHQISHNLNTAQLTNNQLTTNQLFDHSNTTQLYDNQNTNIQKVKKGRHNHPKGVPLLHNKVLTTI